MKKYTLIILAATLSFAACQEEETTLVKENILSATIEQDEMTRTEMDENNNVLWNENDQIIAFLKTSYGHKYQVKPSFVGKSYADFSMVSSSSGNDLSAGNEWDHNVAYYPYSDAIECLKSGEHYVLDVVLPSEQTYVPGSFGNGSMAMVAVSEDNNITFKNVLGGIKLQLKGTQKVKSIKLEGKNSEKLAGAATVMAYIDGATKPAITMASTASTSVILNCDSGVQLNESKATEFIIALPPVLFSKGFTMAVTDDACKTYTVETDKANTVLRSVVLNMPAVSLGELEGKEPGGDEDDGDIVPVGSVKLNKISLVLPTRFSYTMIANIEPIDATDQTPEWSSDNPEVVTIDPVGVITTISEGTANITAVAGGVAGTCSIAVIAPTTREPIDYNVDGVSYGKGVVIGDVIWAPVNCGYESTNGDYKGYPYGRLYQWGRKYGQGYNGTFYVDKTKAGNISDATEPVIIEGPVSAINGQKAVYSNTFFQATSDDWISPQDDKLWNSGTESMPVKTEYDPCPIGWRVPTYAELKELSKHYSSWSTSDGQEGFYFSGVYTYLEGVPSVFLSAAGSRDKSAEANTRGYFGMYWSSNPDSDYASALRCYKSSVWLDDCHARSNGYAVRCVQDEYSSYPEEPEEPEEPSEPQEGDYVDEYGINHGRGIEIDGVVWAPVNCGYHETDYKYGKLYQWGRKYGQGYNGGLFDLSGSQIDTYCDSSYFPPTWGPVSLETGQSKSNEMIFYVSSSTTLDCDWLTPSDGSLWVSGSEYDPCPEGWRVPTDIELESLTSNKSSWTTVNDLEGYWFSGPVSYASSYTSVFLPAAGGTSGESGAPGFCFGRAYSGYYWSSVACMTSDCTTSAKCYGFTPDGAMMVGLPRAYGLSVRCVKD